MTVAQRQTVQAVNGFAYGCVGADVHVFGDGAPVYVLQRWRPERRPDPAWLLALPSRVLNARYAVVDFTGRGAELTALRRWRDHGRRLAIQWLHAPGGQGKSRLAAEFARESAAAGWTVATASRGPGVAHPPPGSQDLRTDTGAGALLIVDYADRWPVAQLTWLLSNTFLHRATDQARVLLLARGRDMWPAVRAAVADLQADASTHALAPLAADAGRAEEGERPSMFRAARDAFAAVYGLPAHLVEPPDELSEPDFGLTLAVHMAALAAVDHHARAAGPPAASDVTGLTAYLLDRERRHWSTLHETGTLGTGQRELSRAAFVAALTGPLPYREARETLELAGLGTDADRLLTDHAYCYPPGAADVVLEPLYPDRLAEDFLALSLPGHDLADHAADPWASDVPELLLRAAEPVANAESGESAEDDGPEGDGLPTYTARALTFLTAAGNRWPHLLATLDTLEARLPEDLGRSEELTAAAAKLTDRLVPHRLSATADPADRARVHRGLARRFVQAGREDRSAAAFTEAVRWYRPLAASDPGAFEAVLAETLFEFAMALVFADLGPAMATSPYAPLGQEISPAPARLDEAAAAFSEAVEIFRRLAAADPAQHQGALIAALGVGVFLVPRLGPSDLGTAAAFEAVDLTRDLARENPEEWAHQLPFMLVASAGTVAATHPARAMALADEAVDLARALARQAPERHVSDLAFVVATRASVLLRLERGEEALDALGEAAELGRRDPRAAPGADPWFQVMAQALGMAWLQDRATGATTGVGVAVRVLGRLARGDTSGRGPALLRALLALSGMLVSSGRVEDVLTVQREILHLLRTSDEIPYTGDDVLGRSDAVGVLFAASFLLARAGRWEEALTHLAEVAEELRGEGDTTFDASMAGGLTEMAAQLSGLDADDGGDPYARMADPGAVRVLERVAETYRRLVRDDPAAHELGLAVTVKLLSEARWKLGRRAEALDANRELIHLRRRLAARDVTAENTHQLALALRRLADKLTHTGQSERAARAAREAADLWRGLSGGAHHRSVGAALHLVAVNLRHLRPAAALSAAEESAALLARFPDDDPAEHRAALATADGLLAQLRSDDAHGPPPPDGAP